MNKLALFGGSPVRSKPFPIPVTIGKEELDSVVEVLKTGVLSGFAASPSNDFFGGKKVLKFEQNCCEMFEIEYSVACNSATSALIMAVGALGIGPGDEVIVPPYTMSATCTSVLIYNAIPVFADIEEDMFCIDPDSIETKITDKTKAIIAVDIHGQSSNIKVINEIAKKHKLKVITDSAQAPGAKHGTKFVGTLGDIGIFSLNRHKNIQCGEGGVAVTHDKELALRMQLIRNHAEALVGSNDQRFAPKDLTNMLGFNFRMTEMEAAVAIEQLKKLDKLNNHRIEMVHYLNEHFKKFPAIVTPKVRENCNHVYYMQALKYKEENGNGIPRSQFIKAINAEGIPIWGGYMKPLYLAPLYQQKLAYKDGYPFKNNFAYQENQDYSKGLCPVAEKLYEKETIINIFNYYPLKKTDMDDIINAFEKIFDNLESLKQ